MSAPLAPAILANTAAPALGVTHGYDEDSEMTFHTERIDGGHRETTVVTATRRAPLGGYTKDNSAVEVSKTVTTTVREIVTTTFIEILTPPKPAPAALDNDMQMEAEVEDLVYPDDVSIRSASPGTDSFEMGSVNRAPRSASTTMASTPARSSSPAMAATPEATPQSAQYLDDLADGLNIPGSHSARRRRILYESYVARVDAAASARKIAMICKAAENRRAVLALAPAESPGLLAPAAEIALSVATSGAVGAATSCTRRPDSSAAAAASNAAPPTGYAGTEPAAGSSSSGVVVDGRTSNEDEDEDEDFLIRPKGQRPRHVWRYARR